MAFSCDVYLAELEAALGKEMLRLGYMQEGKLYRKHGYLAENGERYSFAVQRSGLTAAHLPWLLECALYQITSLDARTVYLPELLVTKDDLVTMWHAATHLRARDMQPF
jgi:hypothetical protein